MMQPLFIYDDLAELVLIMLFMFDTDYELVRLLSVYGTYLLYMSLLIDWLDNSELRPFWLLFLCLYRGILETTELLL